MANEQDWRTESYKGMEVHVAAVAHDNAHKEWEFAVRITQPGDDSTSESELTAESEGGTVYPTKKDAVEAGFAKGYSLVDELLK